MDFYSSEEWFTQKSGHPGGEMATAWMFEAANICAGSRVLDFACGRGDDISFFREHGCGVIGVDVSYEAIEMAKKRYGQDRKVELGCEKEWMNKFPKESIDYILCQCSLSLLGEKGKETLREFRKILRPGGALLLADLFCMEEGESLKTQAKWEELLKETSFVLEVWKDETAVFREYCLQYLWQTGHPFQACAHGAGVEMKLEQIGYFLSVWR